MAGTAEGTAAGTAELGTLIGARVRRHRAERTWTLDDLAGRSGVSRRMLVNIEQGSANPSIATLLRISDALGIGLPRLVEAGGPAAFRVVRAGRAPVLWRGPAGGAAALAAGTGTPDVVELWDWTLAAGEAHSSEPHPAGTRELVLVLAGQVEVRAGPAAQVLARGDSAAFHGDVEHGYANPGGPEAEAARFALAVFQPRACAAGAR